MRLIPVDHQPEFDDEVELLPIDHVPEFVDVDDIEQHLDEPEIE